MPNLDKHPQRVEWISVYSTYSLPEAHIVAGRLQHEDIPAMVNSPIGGAAMGIHLGEIHVLVHPENYLAAAAILNPEDPDMLPDTTNDITYRWEDDDEE
jgi:hypothetical protein